jgi:hypothetical protein
MNRMSQIEPETAMLGKLHLRFANMNLRVETIASPPRGNISTKMPISGDRYNYADNTPGKITCRFA